MTANVNAGVRAGWWSDTILRSAKQNGFVESFDGRLRDECLKIGRGSPSGRARLRQLLFRNDKTGALSQTHSSLASEANHRPPQYEGELCMPLHIRFHTIAISVVEIFDVNPHPFLRQLATYALYEDRYRNIL